MAASMYNSQLVVNLGAIRRNYQTVKVALGGATVIPVLKDNAYGLGAVPVAQALLAEGAACFAVAQASEAVALREAGLAGEILVLGGIPAPALPAVVSAGATVALSTPEGAGALAAEVRRQGRDTYPVQVKIETGLNRYGARPGAELAALGAAIQAAGVLALTGAFTHFADGEQQGSKLAQHQLALFCEGVDELRAAGLQVPVRHVLASGSSEWFGEAALDAARIGRRLYLDAPLLPGAVAPTGQIEEAFTWRSSVVGMRVLEAGETVGYGGAYVAPRDMMVATVCVGYGDGLLAELARLGAPVLVDGVRCRLLATCMDACFVDVTGLSCEVGSEVVFFGRAANGRVLPAQEVAALCGHEGVFLTSMLTGRVERVYEG